MITGSNSKHFGRGFKFKTIYTDLCDVAERSKTHKSGKPPILVTRDYLTGVDFESDCTWWRNMPNCDFCELQDTSIFSVN